MRAANTTGLWLLVLGVSLGRPIQAQAQADHSETTLQQLARRIAPPVPKSKQISDQLMAKTKPDYYARLYGTNPQARLRVINCNTQCGIILTPQPVKLIKFSGQRLDVTQVQITWTTSEEVNNDYFGVQRSANPANGFETIGSVKGQGSSDKPVSYQFADPNTSTDYTYYRLKQVDLDGSFSYSQIIAVKGLLSVLAVLAFPNPAQSQQINFRISGIIATDNVSMVLYDEQGRTLHQQVNAVLDSDQQVGLPASLKLPPGRYYVKIKARSQQATSSFIIRP